MNLRELQASIANIIGKRAEAMDRLNRLTTIDDRFNPENITAINGYKQAIEELSNLNVSVRNGFAVITPFSVRIAKNFDSDARFLSIVDLDSIFRENQNLQPSEPETIEIGDGIAKGAQALLDAINAKETEKAEKIDAAYQAERAAKEEGEALTRQASDYMRQHWQAEENREAEHEGRET